MTTIRRTALAAALIAASFGAHAATTLSWDFTSGGDTSSVYSNSSSWYINGNQNNVRLQAFYADGISNVNSNGTGDSTINSTLASSTASRALKIQGSSGPQAGLATFGGNGVGVANPVDTPQLNGQESSSYGQHAIDNYDYCSSSYNCSSGTHAHDFVLFEFNEVLAPVDFRIGWKQFNNTDVDIFIAPENLSGFSLGGKSINDLIAAGWTRATFTNVQDCVGTSAAPCPTTFASGSYSNSGGALSGMPANLKTKYMVAAGVLGGNDDAFKFASITMNVPGGGTTDVPVPAPLALLAIGGLAMAITRRRKAA